MEVSKVTSIKQKNVGGNPEVTVQCQGQTQELLVGEKSSISDIYVFCLIVKAIMPKLNMSRNIFIFSLKPINIEYVFVFCIYCEKI